MLKATAEGEAMVSRLRAKLRPRDHFGLEDVTSLNLYFVTCFRVQENITASSMSLSATRADVSPTAAANVTSPNAAVSPAGGANAVKLPTTDDERLMASVPPLAEDPPDYDQSPSPSDPRTTTTQPDTGPPTFIPRPKLVEEGGGSLSSTDARPSPVRTKSAEEILEAKLAPALVSDAELIQPVKRAAYIGKPSCSAYLSNIFKTSFLNIVCLV